MPAKIVVFSSFATGPWSRIAVVLVVAGAVAWCYAETGHSQTQPVSRELAGDLLLDYLRRTPIHVSVFDNSPLAVAQRTLKLFLWKKLATILPRVNSGKYSQFSREEWSNYFLPRLTEDCFFVQPSDTYTWQQLACRTGSLSLKERASVLAELAATVLTHLKANKFDLRDFENAASPEDALRLFYQKLRPLVENGRRAWKQGDLQEISEKQCLVELKHLLHGPHIFKNTGTRSAGSIFGRFAEKSWYAIPERESAPDHVDVLAPLEELRTEVTSRLCDNKIDFNDFVNYPSPSAAYLALRKRIGAEVARVRDRWTPKARARIAEDVCIDVVLNGIDPKRVFVNSSSKTAAEIFGRHAKRQWNGVDPLGKSFSGAGNGCVADLRVGVLSAVVAAVKALGSVG